ncbi:MAG: hypothetical protein Q9M36_00335 [Sulfurovum sp.]|nr:hypothetical protein [Sulfurovum sp.]
MAQINFTVSDELKAEMDKAQVMSGADNKPQFLEQMVQALTLAQANAIDTDIDLSKYEAVNSSTKTALHEAFKHILTTIDANFSATKQDAVYVTLEKKALIAKEKAFDVQLAKVTADAKNLIEVANAKSVELIATAQSDAALANESKAKIDIKLVEVSKELETMSQVANQVEFISTENKELRASMSAIADTHKAEVQSLSDKLTTTTGELTLATQSIFKAEIEGKAKDAEIARLMEQLAVRDAEVASGRVTLAEVQGQYQRAVGKLEVLERGEKVVGIKKINDKTNLFTEE